MTPKILNQVSEVRSRGGPLWGYDTRTQHVELITVTKMKEYKVSTQQASLKAGFQEIPAKQLSVHAKV